VRTPFAGVAERHPKQTLSTENRGTGVEVPVQATHRRDLAGVTSLGFDLYSRVRSSALSKAAGRSAVGSAIALGTSIAVFVLMYAMDFGPLECSVGAFVAGASSSAMDGRWARAGRPGVSRVLQIFA
jgi:hypothetical protein